MLTEDQVKAMTPEQVDRLLAAHKAIGEVMCGLEEAMNLLPIKDPSDDPEDVEWPPTVRETLADLAGDLYGVQEEYLLPLSDVLTPVAVFKEQQKAEARRQKRAAKANA